MTVMLSWKRRETRHDRAESEWLRQGMLLKTTELDKFVESLRMEIDEPGGTSDDRPVAGR